MENHGYLRPGTYEEKFVRGSGPGGQNVNKVATTVQLRFFVALSGLAPEVKARLRELAGSRLTADGDILIISEESRSQDQNRQAARVRLAELIERALRPPRRRRATRPTYGSKLRRLDEKKRRSGIKKERRFED